MSMMLLQVSEATPARRRIPFFCMDDDSADNFAPKTGLTFSAAEIQVSKNGATEATSAGTVTEIGGGYYYYEATSGEMDTEGFLLVRPAKADVYSAGTVVQIVPFDPYDTTTLGLTTISTNLDTTVSSRLPTASYEDADAFWDVADAIETGLTPREALKLLTSALAGKISGGGTTTITIRNAVADSKPRITATVDSSGNRTAITYDLT